jgi:putative DNA primase/helicase
MTQNKSLSDFNDLQNAQGLDAVRAQLLKAITEPQLPAPLNNANAEAKNQESEAVFNTTFSIEILLERFAYIMGEDKIWDTLEKIIHKKGAFKSFVGKTIAEEWLNHGSKKFISIANVRSAQKNLPVSLVGGVGVKEMLERYTLIYGTKDVWDNQLRIRLPVATLELAYPNEYRFWLESGVHRHMVLPENIVFDPTMRSGADCINTFDGLPLKPIPKDDIADKCYGIHELLRSMCESDHVFNWVLRWLALPLQKTGTKLASAILFHGEIQGAGKSLFFDNIQRKLYGKYSATLGQHQLESQYSDWKVGNLYSVFEEIFSSSGKYQNMGIVKNQITGKTQRIEKKFVSGWEEANYSNCVFLSNEMQPLPIEPNDRRFLVCWPNHKLDPEILAYAKREMDNPESIQAWYTFLLNLPMNWIEYQKNEDGTTTEIPHTFHSNSEPPMTRAKERLIEYGLPAWEVFYREWKAGRLLWPYKTCKSQDLYTAYTRYCTKSGEKPLTMTKFCTLLSVRERKDLAWYFVGTSRKQATLFLIELNKMPTGAKREHWLGDEVISFADSLKEANQV